LTLSSALASYTENLDRRIEESDVVGIGRDHPLVSTPGTDDHVRIHDIGGAGRCEQPSDVGGVDPGERNHIGRRLADETSKAHVTLGVTDRLREGAGRDCHSCLGLGRPSEQDNDSPAVPIDGAAWNATRPAGAARRAGRALPHRA
jgi:hypothetical protein